MKGDEGKRRRKKETEKRTSERNGSFSGRVGTACWGVVSVPRMERGTEREKKCTVEVDTESDNRNPRLRLFRNVEGETGHEEEHRHEGERHKEERATTEGIDRVDSRCGHDPVEGANWKERRSQFWENGNDDGKSVQPRVAPRAVMSSKPA